MKKYSFIINPAAGHINAEQITKKIKSICSKKNISSEIFITQSPGNAVHITEKLLSEEGTDYLISVGGDGTLNEIDNLSGEDSLM